MLRRTWLKQGTLACSSPVAGLLPVARAQTGPADRPLRLAAASDLKFALALVLEQFQKETGHQVDASFGSSGNFARQIQQGLAVDLFMSADEGFVYQLADAGLTRGVPDPAGLTPGVPHPAGLTSGARPPAGLVPDRGVLYALGRIALYVPVNSSIALDAGLHGLKAQWSQVGKFAIANPEHAPYGRAAREALQKLGLWEMVRPKLVLGENIAQATQFVATGAAQAGITALSLAMAPEVARQGRHVALPDTLHAPLRQRMVLLKSASPAARALYDYLQGAAAREVFRRYGFFI